MPYTDSLAHFYDLSTLVALPDLGIPGGNPGTGANIASNPVGVHGKSTCAEFNGNNSNYNLGDVAELNEVAAFTIAFWMRQDVLDTDDIIYEKGTSPTWIALRTWNDGNIYIDIRNGAITWGSFDYSTVISADTWAHAAIVYDGSGAASIDRLKVYVDGNPVTLAFSAGTIPATTADLSGQDITIGAAAGSFDGLLDAFAIFTRPLTQLQVADYMLATRQNRL